MSIYTHENQYIYIYTHMQVGLKWIHVTWSYVCTLSNVHIHMTWHNYGTSNEYHLRRRLQPGMGWPIKSRRCGRNRLVLSSWSSKGDVYPPLIKPGWLENPLSMGFLGRKSKWSIFQHTMFDYQRVVLNLWYLMVIVCLASLVFNGCLKLIRMELVKSI